MSQKSLRMHTAALLTLISFKDIFNETSEVSVTPLKVPVQKKIQKCHKGINESGGLIQVFWRDTWFI